MTEAGCETSGTRHPTRLARAGLLFVLVVASGLPRAAQAQSAPEPDPWWGPDKALHLGISTALAGTAYGVTALFTENHGVRLVVGGGVAVFAGGLKELIDHAGAGQPSWKDFTWDVIGAATGALLAWLLDVFVIAPLTRPEPLPSTG
ncbi:MAG: hypothetical protein AB1938_17820 [Myxococcota bacterium]